MTSPSEILTFWFDVAGPSKWYKKSDDFDGEIRRRFEEPAIDAAADYARTGGHRWESAPDSALALVVMLDQFPRNMYRGTKGMFAWDALALAAAKKAVAAGFDYKTEQSRRAFFYMPYMHSENMVDQDMCVMLADARLDNESTLHHAKQHRRLIERFGRFAHRNAILGRESTSEELAYLKSSDYQP